MIAYANHSGNYAPRRDVFNLGIPNATELAAMTPPMLDDKAIDKMLRSLQRAVKRAEGEAVAPAQKPRNMTKRQLSDAAIRARHEAEILRVLNAGGPMSSGDIANSIGKSRMLLFKLLTSMESRGLVTRTGKKMWTKWEAKRTEEISIEFDAMGLTGDMAIRRAA